MDKPSLWRSSSFIERIDLRLLKPLSNRHWAVVSSKPAESTNANTSWDDTDCDEFLLSDVVGASGSDAGSRSLVTGEVSILVVGITVCSGMQTGGFLENSRINNRISSSRFPLG
jgi:hypothetical protein